MKKGKKKVRHSPSPWTFGSRNGEERGDGSGWGASGLWTEDNRLILGTGDGWESEYQGPEKADANLIEASPDLLAAAKAVKDAIEKTGEFGAFNPPGYSNEDAEVYDYLIAAIAKAEGRS